MKLNKPFSAKVASKWKHSSFPLHTQQIVFGVQHLRWQYCYPSKSLEPLTQWQASYSRRNETSV